jgi:hypothetical protein
MVKHVKTISVKPKKRFEINHKLGKKGSFKIYETTFHSIFKKKNYVFKSKLKAPQT